VADSRQPTAIFSCPTGTFPRYYRCKTKRPIRVKADNESKGSFYIRGSIGDAVLPFFFLHQQVVEKDRWIHHDTTPSGDDFFNTHHTYLQVQKKDYFLQLIFVAHHVSVTSFKN
jgi:hypothetical protein